MPKSFSAKQPGATRIRFTSQSGLSCEATTSGHDGLLDEFYAAYDRAFVLANEKEGRDGFVACLDLNHGDAYADLSTRYGPYREMVVVVRDQAGAMIAGLNYLACLLPEPSAPASYALCLNLNYVFVASGARRRGLFTNLVSDLAAIARDLFTATNTADLPPELPDASRTGVLIFLEQNDPFAMSPEDYARDSALTGLDPLERIALWGRQGAKVIDFPYVQPALTPDQGPDTNLVYCVMGVVGDVMAPALLRAHLSRFFAISVRKAADLAADSDVLRQLALLDSMESAGEMVTVLSLDGVHLLDRPAGIDRNGNRPATRIRSLREALHGMPTSSSG